MAKFSASHSSSRFCTTSRSRASAPLTLNDDATACSLARPASASRSSATASLSAVAELLERTMSSLHPSIDWSSMNSSSRTSHGRSVGSASSLTLRSDELPLSRMPARSKASPSIVTVASSHSFSSVSW